MESGVATRGDDATWTKIIAKSEENVLEQLWMSSMNWVHLYTGEVLRA